MNYVVKYGGGTGEGVWIDELDVEAESLREALDKTEVDIRRDGGEIYAIVLEGS